MNIHVCECIAKRGGRMMLSLVQNKSIERCAGFYLKVSKHEIFILVDFRDFFTEQTLQDSDLGYVI